MRHTYGLAVLSNALALMVMATNVSTLNYKNFELEADLDRGKLTNYLTSVLCSIDLKNANIYFESESAGKFLDGIVAESTRCVPPTFTIITNESDNVANNTSDGARLIILVAKEFEFEKSMFPKLLRIRKKSNFKLFYMIVSEVKMSTDHEILLQTIYRNYNLLNAVVVAMEIGSTEPTVITYNPFNDTIIRIPDNAYKTKQLFVNKNSNIFGTSINVVMHKDLVTSLTSLEGSNTINLNYEIFLPDLISSAMNATLILKDPSAEESIIEDFRIVDLTINGRSYEKRALLAAGAEETNMVRRDDICILLPNNRIQSTFEIIYRMVDPLVWILMVGVIFQAWMSLLLIRWAQSLTQQCNTARHVFLFDLFGFHMNQSSRHLPKKVPSRLIIASCLMYCLVISSLFDSLIYTSMAKDRELRISTIAELLDSNQYEILISDSFYNSSEHFINNSPIKNHFKVEYSQYIKQYMKQGNSNRIQYAYVLRRRVAKYLENTLTVNGEPFYYTMDECIVPNVVCYFVRQGSPFLDKINEILRIAEESGILKYWEKHVTNAYNKLKQNEPLFCHRSAINFEQLVFVFEALGCGLAIATAVFVFEWYASRLEISARNWSLIKLCHACRMHVK